MDEFKHDLLNMDLGRVYSKWMLNKIPVIFEGNLDMYIDWKDELSRLIEVDSQNILITGSSRMGFSLSPWKKFREFTDKSDVDIAIISNHHFNVCWVEMLNIGTRFHDLTRRQKDSFKNHREKYIWWGTIATDILLPVFPFGIKWNDALLHMGTVPPTNSREVKIRIYKNYESLRLYHVNGFKQLRDILLEEEIPATEIQMLPSPKIEEE